MEYNFKADTFDTCTQRLHERQVLKLLKISRVTVLIVSDDLQNILKHAQKESLVTNGKWSRNKGWRNETMIETEKRGTHKNMSAHTTDEMKYEKIHATARNTMRLRHNERWKSYHRHKLTWPSSTPRLLRSYKKLKLWN